MNTYDFHARMYDPVIGRTFQLDPHSDNYYSSSPYSWAGNNPLLYVDPTGMDLVIAKYKDLSDEEKAKYSKKEYNQMRREGKAAIRQGKKESSTFKAMVKDLKASDNTHTVTFNNDEKGSNHWTDHETGDSQIAVSLVEKAENLEDANQQTHTMVLAGHEMAHSWREEQGLDPALPPRVGDLNLFFKLDAQRKRITEGGATHIENMIRSEQGLPLRQYYYKDAEGGPWYDLSKINFNYRLPQNIHRVHGVKPIKKK